MHTTLTRRGPNWFGKLFVLALGGVVFVACGDDPAPLAAPAETAPSTTAAPTTEAPAEPPADAAVKISQTELGDVLADPRGMTLYAFTNDVDAASTCYGTCAEAWPPVIVDPDFIVSPGLDSGIFATTVREDGTHQLVAGKWPLYLYAADAKPGDVTGHGSGDVWFAVDTSGRTIAGGGSDYYDYDRGADPAEPTADATDPATDPAPAEPAALVALGDTALGSVLTDAGGLTLYLFTPDEAGSPTCTGGCAGAWPPLLVEDGAALAAAEGIDPALLSTIAHPDGGTQLKIGKWPLYYFSGDAGPGDANGQGSGGNWFVVGPDGKAIK